MDNICHIKIRALILTNLVCQLIFLSPLNAVGLSQSALENSANDLSLLKRARVYSKTSTNGSKRGVLVAGSSSQFIENQGYSTKTEYLNSRQYQPSSDYSSSNEKKPPVQLRNPYPLNLGIPYSVNLNIICREQSDGLQLVCLPKEQAERVWGRFPE